MTYEEMAAEVAKLFEYGAIEHSKITVYPVPGFRDEDNALHPEAIGVTAGKMYARPAYIGKGGVIGMLMAIQTILGGNRIVEGEEISQEGCESCDYGSFYAKEWIVYTVEEYR